MANKEFSKKIAGKKVKVIPGTHKTLTGEAWGGQTLCPLCGQARSIYGASTAKSAAELVFNSVALHIKRDHK